MGVSLRVSRISCLRFNQRQNKHSQKPCAFDLPENLLNKSNRKMLSFSSGSKRYLKKRSKEITFLPQDDDTVETSSVHSELSFDNSLQEMNGSVARRSSSFQKTMARPVSGKRNSKDRSKHECTKLNIPAEDENSNTECCLLSKRAYLIYLMLALAAILRSTSILNGVSIVCGHAIWCDVLAKWIHIVSEDSANVKSARQWKNGFLWVLRQFEKAVYGDKARLAYIGYTWFLESDDPSATASYLRRRMCVANESAINEMRR